ncbi:hypothetical protein [Sphingomonas xinjiangensis]|uniref:Uncharacterized protein n=1 Tax=Sphingomonas xinjiangensis TaxID=643568 RepID=A0A840YTG2_9SPHN|nr:hypothetical protein [Sphingomonas xinjiangensis]MBB5712960.1 hypothetical protein [Sphingomonas xinjiangensis]
MLILICTLTLLHSLFATTLGILLAFPGSPIGTVERSAGVFAMIVTPLTLVIGIVLASKAARTRELDDLAKAALPALLGLLCHIVIFVWLTNLPANPAAFR